MTSAENADPGKTKRRRRFWLLVAVLVLVVAAITAGVTALLVNIFEHKQEARNPFYRVVELTDETVDPEIWGKNFPLQYDGYKRTVDQVRTRYGGSEAVPRTPTEADPRSVVAQAITPFECDRTEIISKGEVSALRAVTVRNGDAGNVFPHRIETHIPGQLDPLGIVVHVVDAVARIDPQRGEWTGGEAMRSLPA